MEGVVDVICSGRDDFDKTKWLEFLIEKRCQRFEGFWNFIYQQLRMKKLAEGIICERKNQASLELESFLNARKVLESDINQLENTIQDFAEYNCLFMNDIRMLGTRIELLKLQSVQCCNRINVIKGYTGRLVERKNLIFAQCGRQWHLESSCIRQLKETLSLLKQMSDAIENGDDVLGLQQLTWTKIEAIQTVPCMKLLNSMIDLVRNAEEGIEAFINENNNRQRLCDLSFKFYNGALMDLLLSETTVLKTVEDHIFEAKLVYVDASQKCILLKKEADNCLQKLKFTLGEWTDLECDDYMIEKFIQLDQECTGYEAGIDVLTASSKSFHDLSEQISNFLSGLSFKAAYISEYNAVIKSNENNIKKVIRSNSCAKEQIQRQLAELSVYIVKNIHVHKPDWITLMTNLVDFVEHESCLLSTINISKISTVNHKVSSLETVKLLQEKVKDPCKADCSMDYKDFIVLSKTCFETFESSCSSLCSTSLLASKAFADISVIHELCLDWWNQPAGSLVDWVWFEGMTITQWLQQWRVLTQRFVNN